MAGTKASWVKVLIKTGNLNTIPDNLVCNFVFTMAIARNDGNTESVYNHMHPKRDFS
jgi:hypothetical protein